MQNAELPEELKEYEDKIKKFSGTLGKANLGNTLTFFLGFTCMAVFGPTVFEMK